jgi:hypothetical protein
LNGFLELSRVSILLTFSSVLGTAVNLGAVEIWKALGSSTISITTSGVAEWHGGGYQ